MAPVEPCKYIITLAFPISLQVANTFSTLNDLFDNKCFTNPSPIPLFAPVTNTEHILIFNSNYLLLRGSSCSDTLTNKYNHRIETIPNRVYR